ncbi:TonB-dependent receptor [Hirschia maritima]|uniref:TonB-dependent receptor n=1 Tax=Hirschia maritima TaxID=1121961 RepID=UPI00036D24CE|nr:TonB-dependent receptor [Hirschia maritima]
MKKINRGGVGQFQLQFGASLIALSTVLSAPAMAQDVAEAAEDTKTLDTIVVTGIRQALTDGMNVKRKSNGVVDAINAEDIGKFPDSNLAESLQRIPGVSINRQNGEGSQITVRGFGPGFNAVTLNGRSMPTADIPLIGGNGSGTGGSSRAFDFSNLAAESVSALEVTKTGRADVASGGIGATVNVVTARPLDSDGLVASVGVKGVVDTSVDTGDEITPELNGIVSWSNEAGTFGVGVTGSYSKRDSAAPSVESASWNIEDIDSFLDPANGRVTAATNVVNAPSSGNIALPRDSRANFSEFSSERINGQIVMQFAPTERLEMTADYTFATNEGEENRTQVSNWFSRPFSEVIFDDSPVPTTVGLTEVISGTKDWALQQTTRATKDELQSFGFNTKFQATDNFEIVFDAHTSEAEVTPNGISIVANDGQTHQLSEVNVGMAWPIVVSHSVDYSGDAPIQTLIDAQDTAISNDGVFDRYDVATNIANGIRSVSQKNEIDQFDLRANWDLDDMSRLTVGANYRTQSNRTTNATFQQTLGNWGLANPGDVQAIAPDALEEFCLSCQFDDYNVGDLQGVRGDAATLFQAISSAYINNNIPGYTGAVFASDTSIRPQGSADDTVEEDVLSLYAQFSTEFEVANRPAYLNVGLRYEDTEVTAKTATVPPSQLIWTGNNDFTLAIGSGDGLTLQSSYDNWLPNVDFAVDITDSLKARASYSKTIARTAYNNLFASDALQGTPAGPTAFDNIASATQGDPGLLPLESDNFDLSVEYYFGESSYVSVGIFEKVVRNFVGTETYEGNLFGLRDATTDDAGTRTGIARGLLDTVGADPNDNNLFAMAVFVDQNPGDTAAAVAAFQAVQGADGNIITSEYDNIETLYDLVPNADDPLYVFDINRPVNNEQATINGIEIQGQHFFGDTGFGIMGSYTLVEGDVGYDVTGDPSASQFALTGLSDTANLTFIYENYGFSGRLAYNWRDEFLLNANAGGGFNNPVFVEAYGQVDASLNYDLTDNIALSLDAINLTGESSRWFGRSTTNLWFARESSPRYYLGARYKF